MAAEHDSVRDLWESANTMLWAGDPECEPIKAYPGDAGFDLFVAKDTRIHVGGQCDVDLGIHVQLPVGVWALITGRSSTLRRRGLLVVNGIIDNGYRGPMFAYVHNLSNDVVELERGERIAQLILHHAVHPRVDKVDALEVDTERGQGMFGSTGM